MGAFFGWAAGGVWDFLVNILEESFLVAGQLGGWGMDV